MNIYNLQDFKCTTCAKWYHPRNAMPFALTCGHSVCTQCLGSRQKGRGKEGYVLCTQHSTFQPLNQAKLNTHILQALERLLKNHCDSVNSHGQTSQLAHDLDRLLTSREKDVKDFVELLDQIYTNEINRLIQLKNRVKQELRDPAIEVSQWKQLLKQCKNEREVMEEGKHLEKRVKEFCQLDLEWMAQQVIASPALCLQRHFSIYDLIARLQPRKTLKSSVKSNHQRLKSNFNEKYLTTYNQQNIPINLSRHPESPRRNKAQIKLLSSFKLDHSVPNDTTNDIGQTTLRDFQKTKCMNKSKTNPQQQRQKRSTNDEMKSNFMDLINSLKIQGENDPLQYSPQQDELLLLSDRKADVNFLKEWEMQKPLKKDEMEVRQKELICCEREKNKYIRKLQVVRTEEAQSATTINGTVLELFNFDIKEIDLVAYLNSFNWKQLEVVKLVGTGLQDSHLNILLNFLLSNHVHTLLLPSNELQEVSLDALLRFSQLNGCLKVVSLQKNNIHTLHSQTRAKAALLKRKGITLYI